MAKVRQSEARKCKGVHGEKAGMRLVDKFRNYLIADLKGMVKCSLHCTM